ncbi:zinc-binding dehydrogenase [Spiractinospora alimapuensis]|uniref:zinc-binding dehydrogenase n=1 Tax=Spiractinospora alimapuensis TaxID=2820884 RepID=UPI002ECFD17A
MPHESALAVLSDGATACWASDTAAFRAGEWVLVTAACGGAGSLVVQLARAAGTRVVGAASGRLKLDRVRALGAEAVVDYSQAGWADRVRDVTDGAGASVVVDGTGGRLAEIAYSTLADGGTFVSYGVCDGPAVDVDEREAAARGIGMRRLVGCAAPRDDEQRLTRRALDLVRRGELTPLIALTIPLDRAVDAHILLEQRAAAGKVLLVVGG